MSFNTISELIESMYRNGDTIAKAGAQLKNPIFLQDWEIRHSLIEVGSKIGSGAFGIVYKGDYKNQQVAIKSCSSMSNDDLKKFFYEFRKIYKFDHKNIVKFIGLAIDEKPVYILMEFINGGCLHSFLQKHHSIDRLPTSDKLKLCEDCAEGMEYLERNNVVHR
jgi:serine/threonine protein kinase